MNTEERGEARAKLLADLMYENESKDLEVALFRAKLTLEGLSIKKFCEMQKEVEIDRNLFNNALNGHSAFRPEYNEIIRNYMEDVEVVFQDALENHRKRVERLPSVEYENKLIQRIKDESDEIEKAKLFAQLHDIRFTRTLGKRNPDFSGRAKNLLIKSITK